MDIACENAVFQRVHTQTHASEFKGQKVNQTLFSKTFFPISNLHWLPGNLLMVSPYLSVYHYNTFQNTNPVCHMQVTCHPIHGNGPKMLVKSESFTVLGRLDVYLLLSLCLMVFSGKESLKQKEKGTNGKNYRAASWKPRGGSWSNAGRGGNWDWTVLNGNKDLVLGRVSFRVQFYTGVSRLPVILPLFHLLQARFFFTSLHVVRTWPYHSNLYALHGCILRPSMSISWLCISEGENLIGSGRYQVFLSGTSGLLWPKETWLLW